MICPDCSYDNIAGADTCDKCGQPLTRYHLPASEMERSIISHPVSVIAQKRPVSVTSSTPVRQAVATMVQNRIGCVLVLDGTALTGIFTERDVLNRIGPDRSALDHPINRHMTPSPETVKLTDSIAYALHCMSLHGLRHLPVVDGDGSAVSIVSARDILRLLAVRFADIRSE
jgi:CBS domain-containing protein